MELLPWKNLYQHYKGTKYSSSENHRKFRAWTGVHPVVAEIIFDKYQHTSYLPNRSSLLIVLHFLKDMPTEDEASSSFKIECRTTYRNILWGAIRYLDYMMNEINLKDR